MTELVLDVIARKNSRELTAMANDFKKLAAESEATGKSFNKTAGFSKHLDTEIANTRKVIGELRQEFERTGDVDVFAKLRGTQGNLSKLEGIKRQLEKAFKDAEGEAERGGRQLGKAVDDGLFSGLGERFQGGGGIAQLIAGLALSPPGFAVMSVAGTTLGSVLMTGAGAGGVAAGIALAARSPEIKSAVDLLKVPFKAAGDEVGGVFIAPLHNAIDEFSQNAEANLGPTVAAFRSLAGAVVPLERGFSGLLAKAAPGFNAFLRATRPLLDRFAQELPTIGTELNRLFTAMAREGGSAKEALVGLLKGVEIGLRLTTASIYAFGTTFRVVGSLVVNGVDDIVGAFDMLAHIPLPGSTNPFGPLVDKLDDLKAKTSKMRDNWHSNFDAASEGTPVYNDLADAFSKTATAADRTQAAVGRLTTALGERDAAIGYQQAIDDLTASLKENGKTVDIGTQKGRDNVQAIDAVINAIEAQREAAIDSGKSTAQANAQATQSYQNLRTQLIKSGIKPAIVDNLLAPLKATLDTLNQINGKKVNFSIFGHYTGPGSVPYANKPIPYAEGGIRHAATGLLIPPSNPGTVITAEPQTGGEALIPLQGISRPRASMLLNTVARGYGMAVTAMGAGGPVRGGGGGTSRFEFAAAPGDQVAEALFSVIRPVIRGRYGGNIQAALGGG